MNFLNSMQKLKTWSADSYSFIQRLLGIVYLFILDSLMPGEVDIADAPGIIIDERLGALEDAVRLLSAEFAQFNHALTNQAPTAQG
ncbi:unnamed protein product [Aphis gossypii]|uniref:Uncharacterized protein n=1 Tax=Aphis gossypii TaxID=80765 RepID=A0A9P0JDF0_APHGO|nr:unnamed protein product [Aphis gossypii]